jgi:protein phosphatase
MSAVKSGLRFALLCDKGKQRIGNEDAGHCADAIGLFTVSDGMGGLPGGGAASQVIVHTLPHFLERAMLGFDDETDDAAVQAALSESLVQLSRRMYEQSRHCHGLLGWGATVVAVLVRGRKAHIMHVGDSRAYLVRQNKLVTLTDDHSHVSQLLSTGKLVTEEYEQKNRNLVSQHVAMLQPIQPTIRTVRLQDGDRLLLCSDGLTAAVEDKTIGRLLVRNREASAACQALVDQANANGGPDNITALVLDVKDVGDGDSHERGPLELADSGAFEAGQTELPREAGQIHELLLRLERELDWLHQGARETAGQSKLAALAAAKRLLGADIYLQFVRHHPSDNPAHTFHQACVGPEGQWRRNYDAVMQVLDPLMAKLVCGEARLSPLLSKDDAALIMRTLWTEFRGIERRYFAICRRYALDKRERSLDILIEHMLESTRVLIGLIQFLPAFGA